MRFKERTVDAIADMVCGNFDQETSRFVYRSSSYLTKFFRDCDTDYAHDGSTRNAWVAHTLREILEEPQPDPSMPPDTFAGVIRVLMDQADATNEGPDRPQALEQLNAQLAREGFEAFYAPDRQCYLRNIQTQRIAKPLENPHRALSTAEVERRERLSKYLKSISEDEFTEEVLVPLFRHLGFQRVTVSGHRDKLLEYGGDLWMRFPLPTGHLLYFGIQAKIGKIDANGASKPGNRNVAEILNQVSMLLGKDIFDSDVNRHVLVDHAVIISAGEITKAAKQWLGTQLDASRRSQILFMDRDDILNLFIVGNLPLPSGACPPSASGD